MSKHPILLMIGTALAVVSRLLYHTDESLCDGAPLFFAVPMDIASLALILASLGVFNH